MYQSGDIDFEEIERRVQARMDEVLSSPDADRYDINRDGELDDYEKDLLHQVLWSEIYGEFVPRQNGCGGLERTPVARLRRDGATAFEGRAAGR